MRSSGMRSRALVGALVTTCLLSARAHGDPGYETRRVTFRNDKGDELVGTLYVPTGTTTRGPAVVMAGPMGATKEHVLPNYAPSLAKAGYVALAFDYRGFGESGGRPRQDIDPDAQVRDLKSAVTYLGSLPEVDRDRIGAVGVCMGGGMVVKLAAEDPRVKSVTSIAGAFTSPRYMKEQLGESYETFKKNYRAMAERGESVAIVASNGGPAAMPGEEPWLYYGKMAPSVPTWKNELTARSVYKVLTRFDSLDKAAELKSPFLVVHLHEDPYTPTPGAQLAFDKAPSAQKELVWSSGQRHIDLYDNAPFVNEAAAATVKFLQETLPTRPSRTRGLGGALGGAQGER